MSNIKVNGNNWVFSAFISANCDSNHNVMVANIDAKR